MTDPSTVPAPLTKERLAEISARLVAISPWPWQQTRDIKLGVKLWDRDGHAMFRAIPDVRHSHVSEESPEPQWQHDTDFVRCAPADLADLLAHTASLEARCEELAKDKVRLDWLDSLTGDAARCAEGGPSDCLVLSVASADEDYAFEFWEAPTVLVPSSDLRAAIDAAQPGDER